MEIRCRCRRGGSIKKAYIRPNTITATFSPSPNNNSPKSDRYSIPHPQSSMMHFSIVAVTTFSLFSSALANTCTNRVNEMSSGTVWYQIHADSVPEADVPGRCGGLWDNLKQFPDCIGVSSPTCEARDGGLQWDFTNGLSCNEGMVVSTFQA
jgi:hypothetical protein